MQNILQVLFQMYFLCAFKLFVFVFPQACSQQDRNNMSISGVSRMNLIFFLPENTYFQTLPYLELANKNLLPDTAQNPVSNLFRIFFISNARFNVITLIAVFVFGTAQLLLRKPHHNNRGRLHFANSSHTIRQEATLPQEEASCDLLAWYFLYLLRFSQRRVGAGCGFPDFGGRLRHLADEQQGKHLQQKTRVAGSGIERVHVLEFQVSSISYLITVCYKFVTIGNKILCSWHEIGFYDVAANMDYIEKVTGFSNVSFVGHSQGGTVYLALAASRPEYDRRITFSLLLAPVVYLKHARQLIVRTVVDNPDIVEVSITSCFMSIVSLFFYSLTLD